MILNLFSFQVVSRESSSFLICEWARRGYDQKTWFEFSRENACNAISIDVITKNFSDDRPERNLTDNVSQR